jgi:hypothetical protein
MRSGQQKNVLISRYIEVAPITLLRTRYTKHKFAFHYHAEAVVAFVVCGEEWFEICDETIRGAPGAVVFMNPYEPHRGWTDTDAPTDYRAVHIPINLLRTICGSDTKFTTRIVQSKKLVADLSEWHDILSSSQDLELCRGALKGLLARLRDYVAPVLIEKIGIGESEQLAGTYVIESKNDHMVAQLRSVDKIIAYITQQCQPDDNNIISLLNLKPNDSPPTDKKKKRPKSKMILEEYSATN